jgi:outer membrane biosynthesis protein TonB
VQLGGGNPPSMTSPGKVPASTAGTGIFAPVEGAMVVPPLPEAPEPLPPETVVADPNPAEPPLPVTPPEPPLPVTPPEPPLPVTPPEPLPEPLLPEQTVVTSGTQVKWSPQSESTLHGSSYLGTQTLGSVTVVHVGGVIGTGGHSSPFAQATAPEAPHDS